MSLIERMSTTDLLKVYEFEQQYPAVGRELLSELRKCEYWHYLPYNTVCQLNDVFKCGYAPHEIGPLFR